MDDLLNAVPVEDLDPDGKPLQAGQDASGAVGSPDLSQPVEHREHPLLSQAHLLAPAALRIGTSSAGDGRTTRARWIVRWRGLDEEFATAADAMDRQDQLEAHGIEAEMFEVMADRRRTAQP